MQSIVHKHAGDLCEIARRTHRCSDKKFAVAFSRICVISLCVLASEVRADTYSERLSVGTTPDRVSATLGVKPFATECKAVLTVEYCTSQYKRAEFDFEQFTASFYEVTFVSGRMVSVSVKTRQGKF